MLKRRKGQKRKIFFRPIHDPVQDDKLNSEIFLKFFVTGAEIQKVAVFWTMHLQLFGRNIGR